MGKVVADAAGHGPVRIPAGEFPGVGTRIRCGAPLASPSSVMAGTAMAGAAARRFPERHISPRPGPGRAASGSCGSRCRHGPDCRKLPRCDRRWRRRSPILWGSQLPDQPGKIAPVLLVAGAAAFGDAGGVRSSRRAGPRANRYSCSPAGPADTTCPAYWGRSSVIVNHGALDPTKMCSLGRIVGSSTKVPMATWTKAPSRTVE
jgi:hypothetical protein